MRRQEEKNVVTVRLKEIGQTANSHFLLPQSNPRQTQTEKTVETKDFTEKLQSSSFNEQAYKASPADAAPTDTTPFCCRVNINQAGY